MDLQRRRLEVKGFQWAHSGLGHGRSLITKWKLLFRHPWFALSHTKLTKIPPVIVFFFLTSPVIVNYRSKDFLNRLN